MGERNGIAARNGAISSAACAGIWIGGRSANKGNGEAKELSGVAAVACHTLAECQVADIPGVGKRRNHGLFCNDCAGLASIRGHVSIS